MNEVLISMAKHLKPREISRSYNLLHVKEKRKLGLFVAVQILLSFLDLIGIFMLGILISVAVNDNQNSKYKQADGIISCHDEFSESLNDFTSRISPIMAL